MSATLFAGLDAASALRMARLAETGPIFAEVYTAAMAEAVTYVKNQAQNFAPVRDIAGGGRLKGGIKGHVLSPFVGVVEVDQNIPYAKRREFGFSGRYDSLNRYYPNDPGSYYMRRAMQTSLPYLATLFSGETRLALRLIAS